MLQTRILTLLYAAIVYLGLPLTEASVHYDQPASLAFFKKSNVEVGVGIADVTGPAADVNFMGYAQPAQVGAGIHFRLRARAFVFRTPNNLVGTQSNVTDRLAFVSIDMGMGSGAVTDRVLELLEAEPTTQGLFTRETICLSGTHTHSGPAGFLSHTLFQITSWGFVHQSFDAFSNGIAEAIIRANANLQKANVVVGHSKLNNANINRSPTAYTFNPKEERDQYADEGDTDKNMTLLKIVSDDDGSPLGMINWFSVHGTSMNNTNGLISGDNKGLASLLFEDHINPAGTTPGQGDFVAAFAATNLGDVSPNTNGSMCIDTGLPCEMMHSTCNNRTEMCIASGPGRDMFESTKIIANRQFEAAKAIFDSDDLSTVHLDGLLDARHSFVDMSNLTFVNEGGEELSTCEPAMGYAFAAGTTDGPGAFNFVQGDNTTNPFWNLVSGILSKPTDEQIACHAPKPILLNLGGINYPYPWAASVVPLQLLRLGSFFIVSVPSELTTMAGRRMRSAVSSAIIDSGMEANPVVVIAGLANEYADYTTTKEEYQAQRYEGASTAYGSNELEAFIAQMKRLVNDMAAGRQSDTADAPSNHMEKQIELRPGVLFDSAGLGNFGDVTMQPEPTATRGVDTVAVEFRSANPRNNLRTEDTFLEVQRQKEGTDNEWETVATDGHWETKFIYFRNHKVSAESFARIEWEIPADASKGTYRVVHYAAYKSVTGKITEFSGISDTFEVVA